MGFNDGLPPRLMWLLGIGPEKVWFIWTPLRFLWPEGRLQTVVGQSEMVDGCIPSRRHILEK